MYIKFHEKVLAVCDENLIGREFKEGKLCLKISERFYKGKKVNAEELKEILRNAVNANIAGQESVNIAISIGLVDKKEVIYIEGIPHAQFFVL